MESKLTKTLKQSWEQELITPLAYNKFATFGCYVEWCLKELRAREVVFESEKEKSQESKTSSVYKSSDVYSSQALTSGTRGLGQNVNTPFSRYACFGCRNFLIA